MRLVPDLLARGEAQDGRYSQFAVYAIRRRPYTNPLEVGNLISHDVR